MFLSNGVCLPKTKNICMALKLVFYNTDFRICDPKKDVCVNTLSGASLKKNGDAVLSSTIGLFMVVSRPNNMKIILEVPALIPAQFPS